MYTLVLISLYNQCFSILSLEFWPTHFIGIFILFYFFLVLFGTWKSQFCLGYWKIFLLEIWVLVPIAQNLKDQMQISVTRREKVVGPVTVINWDPHKFSLDLNPAWIKKQGHGCSQICHGTHIKFKLGFQSLLKNSLPNIFFFLVRPSDYGFESLNHNSKTVYQRAT